MVAILTGRRLYDQSCVACGPSQQRFPLKSQEVLNYTLLLQWILSPNAPEDDTFP